MKPRLLVSFFVFTLFLIFGLQTSFAQENEDEDDGLDIPSSLSKENVLETLLGYARIGDQNFIGFRFKPELHLGKLGVGLDIPMQFNMSDWSLRTDEFKSGVGALRLIRFVSWGLKKRDP